jgi:hypothetical protein
MEALGFLLANRGRSTLDLRSRCVSEMEEEDEEEREDRWTLSVLSLTGGMAGTGEIPESTQAALAMERELTGRGLEGRN